MNQNHSQPIAPQLALIIQNIGAAENILLLTHQDPDSDAIGSTYSLYQVLQHLGKKPHLIYVLSHPKRPLPPAIPAKIINLRDEPAPTIRLANYDYALCLDCSYSTRQITGLIFAGLPRFGVGIIDHHSHHDPTFCPEQDYTLRSHSSTCEIIYDIVHDQLLSAKNLPPEIELSVNKLLLRGMLEDMVGLTIAEKVYSSNLAILEKIKQTVAKSWFDQELRACRTLRLPIEITSYGKYFKRYLALDKSGKAISLYLLSIPQDKTVVFKKIYNQSILLFDHYARLSCLEHGDNYGILVLLMDNFEPDFVKISVRGAYTKLLFKPLIDRGYFPSCGISGNSALGGKMHRRDSLKNIGTSLMAELKKTALQVDFSSAAPITRPRIEARLAALVKL